MFPLSAMAFIFINFLLKVRAPLASSRAAWSGLWMFLLLLPLMEKNFFSSLV